MKYLILILCLALFGCNDAETYKIGEEVYVGPLHLNCTLLNIELKQEVINSVRYGTEIYNIPYAVVKVPYMDDDGKTIKTKNMTFLLRNISKIKDK